MLDTLINKNLVESFIMKGGQATVDFRERVNEIYDERNIRSMTRDEFKRGVIRRCLKFLDKDDPHAGV